MRRALPNSSMLSLRCISVCAWAARNKEEITLDVLKEAHAVVFGCPREKFSASEVRQWGGVVVCGVGPRCGLGCLLCKWGW